jgi:hypothetical protein
MRKLRQVALGLGLLGLLTFGGAAAAAKEAGKRSTRSLSGVVLSVDSKERIITVREFRTGRVLAVRLPQGQTVRTNLTIEPSLQIDRIIPGMTLKEVAVR